MLAVILILTILIISFILALRSLNELEVPEEAKKAIKRARPKLKVSGIFLFFKDKASPRGSARGVLHYPTSESSSSTKPSSAASDSSSDKTVSGLTKV